MTKTTTMSDSSKILFVINPISGDTDKQYLLEEIDKTFPETLYQYTVYYTTGENDKEEISKKITSFHPDIVAVAGGDGTCNLVAQIIKNTSITLGIIPVGSANGLATELDIDPDIKEALKTIKRNTVKAIDILSVNRKYISIHLCDLGFNARVVRRFAKENTRGFIGYIRAFFREFSSVKASNFSFVINKKTILRHKAYMVVLANATKFGTGAIINPIGKPDDGIFELCIIKPFPLWFIFHLLIASFLGNLHKIKYTQIIHCKHLEIDNSQNEIFQVDGEAIDSIKKIEVEIIPKALRVIYP